jgi:ankyrin repeat protein
MDMLKDLVTVGEIKETLRVLESGDVGLDEIYKASMKRIKGQNPAARKRALRILSWISHAKRPLTAEELRYALAVNEGDTALNGDHLIPEEHITRVCAGLIRIEQGVGKISWIHDTARAYFESHRQVLFPDTEKVISRVCLTYLCFDTFASGPCKKSEEFSQWLESWPFLNYAATHWGSHLPAEMASDYLVMHFLEKKEHVETAGQVLLAPRRTASRGYEIAGTFGTTPVHLSAYFGLLDAAKELLLKGYPSDEEDSAGCTPLSYAAENGHREVVSLMLSNGARPDAAYATSSNERTPLSFAAENGHEDVTRLLLDFGASPTPRRRRRASKPTPLTYASGNGHLVIVNLLLQAHEPDEPWDDNEMALSAAAEEGHVEIVRALLDKGCHPDLKWERGNNRLGTRFRTPLSYAAGAGHASVVHLLLERGGNVETYDNSNRTPLFFAAEKGDMHVIDILLQKGNADVNVADYQGNTPLSRAVDRGDIEVVKELLDRGANPDTSRTSSEIQVDSPLLSAVSAGRTELVRLLIGTGKVRTDPTEDWDGTSALCYAAKLGYRDIVQLLLQGANVRLNHETSKGRTPLSFAAASGHKDIVKILIETQGIDADRRDRKGRTPLSHAAYNGHEDVVRILLAHPDVNPENEDNSGHTPLYCAFLGRHTNIIRVLLDETSGRVNPETEDQDGLTQLAQASRDGNLEAVEFLLSLDVVKPDSKDKKGRTPFLHAASNGHLDVVKALLHTSKVNVNLVDVDGASAIHHAARYHHGSPYDKGSAGHDEVLAFLLDTCAPKLADLPDKKGRSPLTYAAKAGRAAAVSMLIATPHANACHRDDNGREPLSYAAQKGTAGIIQTILNVVVVNINAVDNEGKTALWWLVYGESARVTKRRFFSLAGRIQAKTEALQVLLQHNSLDINAATLSGAQTPLMLAAETGVEPMLRVILGDKRTDPNAKDANNRTALQIAVQQGHSGCVEALLGDLRVSLSPSCTGGWTPLWWAAQYGYEQITKLCLDKPDVDPNAADENGRTPLAFAVETYQKGRFENEEDKTGVVKLLLTHHSLDPNIKDKQGRTPLRVAEGYGKYRGETMRLLLADNRVDPSAMLPEWTPLWWLCQRADEEAMRLLFRRPDLDLDSRDAYGRSPLSYAAEGGSEEIVTALLASGKVDPETRDNEGFSPLFRAIAELEEDWDYKTAGLIRIIKLLLAQEAVRLDFRGETAWKPKKSYSQKPDPILVWAVKQGDAEILRLMLEKKQADPNAEDEDGASALWHAADKRNKEMAEMLLKIDGVEVNKKITQGRTPFFIAVQTSPAIARKLFGTGSVDLESRDEYGRTAILRALEGPTATFEGVTEVINFLLRLGANPDVADVCGRTPLSYAAASYTFHEVLRILLNTEGVDPNSVDSIGMTPLSYAAGNDNSDGVKILLADERVDVGIMDNNGLTALDHAEAYFAKTYSVILLRRRMGLPDICYDDLEWEEVNQARQTPSA